MASVRKAAQSAPPLAMPVLQRFTISDQRWDRFAPETGKTFKRPNLP